MNSVSDLILPLLLFAVVALWMQLSRARERATAEALRLCRQHGLQLLDDSVGLRGLRLRRRHARWHWERCYGFEVSIDGDDRESSQLWMVDGEISGFSLPTIRAHQHTNDDQHRSPPSPQQPLLLPEPAAPFPPNVVPLRPRQPGQGRTGK